MVANQLARWTPEPRCSRSRSLAPPPRPRRQTGGAGDRGGECRWDAKGTGKGRLALRVPSVLSSSSLSFVGGKREVAREGTQCSEGRARGRQTGPEAATGQGPSCQSMLPFPLFLTSPAHRGRDHLSAAERSVHTRPRARHARSTHHARARHDEHTVINFMKNLLMINETDGAIHLISFSNTQRYECLSFHVACLNVLIFLPEAM